MRAAFVVSGFFALSFAVVGGCSSSSDDASGASDAGTPTNEGGTDGGTIGDDAGSGTTTDADSDGGGGGPAGPGSTIGWTASDALTVQTTAGCILTGAQTLAECTPIVRVFVNDVSTHASISDAVVTVSFDGAAPVAMVYEASTYYDAHPATFAKTYRFEIAHGSDHVVILGTAPDDFTLTAPATTPMSTAATITWTPTYDAFANLLSVLALDDDLTPPAVETTVIPADDGSFAIPATSFPGAGTYKVQLMKEQLAQLVSPSRTGSSSFTGQIFHDCAVLVH